MNTTISSVFTMPPEEKTEQDDVKNTSLLVGSKARVTVMWEMLLFRMQYSKPRTLRAVIDLSPVLAMATCEVRCRCKAVGMAT
jgi:hypothetical protein